MTTPPETRDARAPHRRFGEAGPASVNLEARTVEAIVSTFAEAGGHALDPAGADLSRLVGGPVLDAHRAGSTRDVLGVVEAAEVRPEGLWCRLRFRDTDAGRAVLDGIAAGELRGVSIGYRVTERGTRQEGRRRVAVATRWAPMEVSVVPLPADPGAHFRAEDEAMEHETDGALAERETEAAAPEARGEGARETRAAVNCEIRSIAETAGLDRGWADEQIDAEATVDEARASAFSAMRQRSAATSTRTQRASVGVDHTDPASVAERAGEALYARAHPEHELSPAARSWAGLDFRDLAREVLRLRGERVTGFGGADLITRALHSTSDFPLILGDAVGRELRRSYEAAPEGARMLARQTTARDFRERRAVMLGEGPELEKVLEGGEYTYGTIAEGAESYRVETFGRIFSISRQALINDDLGAFTRIPAMMGEAARAFEAKQIVQLIEANPLMSDGVAVFAAGHSNLGTAGALSETTLSEARLLMRRQTGLGGTVIGIGPRYVLVPPALETAAEKLLAEITPNVTEAVNPFSALTLVVDPRLTDEDAFYVAADPARADGIEFAYLESAPGPQIETKAGFEVDGMSMKVRLDLGVGWIDHRSWVRNAGTT